MKDYTKYIESERRIARTLIRPMNIYRISSYRDVGGDFRRLIGRDYTLIFVIGIHGGKLSCIKITELEPEEFFGWLRTIVNIRTDMSIDEMKRLEDILVKRNDVTGKRIFEEYVKNSTLVYKNKKEPAYRTYILSGISYVMEVTLKKSILKLYYG